MGRAKRRGAEPDGKSGIAVHKMITNGSRGCPPQHGISRDQVCHALAIGTEHAGDILRALVNAGVAVRVSMRDKTKRFRWCAPEHKEACERYIDSITAQTAAQVWVNRAAITERQTRTVKAIDQVFNAVAESPAGMTVPECMAAVAINNRQVRKLLAALVEEGKLQRMHFGCKAKSIWFTPEKQVEAKTRADMWLAAWEETHKYSKANRRARQAADMARRREAARLKAEEDEESIDPPIVRKWVRADTTYKPTGRMPANSVWQWGKQC
jgi:hypothetical protein